MLKNVAKADWFLAVFFLNLNNNFLLLTATSKLNISFKINRFK